MEFMGLFMMFAFLAIFGRQIAKLLRRFITAKNRHGRIALLITAAVLFAMLFGFGTYQYYSLDEPLWGASYSGNAGEVKALLARGASPEARWKDGTTALQAARKSGREDIVKLLRDAGAKE